MRADQDEGLRLAAYSSAAVAGGAERQLGTLLARLPAGFEVTVIGDDPSVVEWIAGRRRGADAVVIPAIGGKLALGAMRRFRRLLARLAPDVLHVTLPVPWAARQEIAVALTLPGLPVVAVEQLPLPPPGGWQRLLKRTLARRYAAHVAVGERAARRMEAEYGLEPRSMIAIHNAVEDHGVRRREPSSAPVVAGTIARHDRQKGLDVLLTALAGVPGVRLELVGDGPERAALERLAGELGLGDRVRLHGWSEDAVGHLAGWDLFVLPSRFEGLPLTICEAMLAELPVVASDVGSVAEAVEDGETGLLVPAEDAAALGAALRRISGDLELRRRLGNRARAVALERFEATAMARAYEQVYRECARARRGRAGR